LLIVAIITLVTVLSRRKIKVSLTTKRKYQWTHATEYAFHLICATL